MATIVQLARSDGGAPKLAITEAHAGRQMRRYCRVIEPGRPRVGMRVTTRRRAESSAAP